MSQYKVGICGVGFVGNAIMQHFSKINNIELVTYDKYKEVNTFEPLLDCEILFLCLPTPYSSHLKTYYMKEINIILEALAISQYKGCILLKSTVLPDYCGEINKVYKDLKIVHNPEFLSCKTAVTDFAEQKHIVLGFTEQSAPLTNYIKTFYGEIFPRAEISITKSECSALMKLGCNSFYATKIQFFTEFYLLCQSLNLSYEEVKELMLKNEWINPRHTDVPGSDQDISFGGACLPKDISALNAYMECLDVPNTVINAVISERNEMRND